MGEWEEYRTLGYPKFSKGKCYYDAVGRRWKVVAICYTGDGKWTLIVRRMLKHRIAIAENKSKTAIVLFDYGFTTIYADEEVVQ